MFKSFAVLALTCALAVANAATPSNNTVRIDATSAASAEASYKAMMKGRPEPDRQKLALAVLVINMAGVQSAYDMVGNPELQSPSIGRIREKVAGMTADEIMGLAANTKDVNFKVDAK